MLLSWDVPKIDLFCLMLLTHRYKHTATDSLVRLQETGGPALFPVPLPLKA